MRGKEREKGEFYSILKGNKKYTVSSFEYRLMLYFYLLKCFYGHFCQMFVFENHKGNSFAVINYGL